MNETAIVAVHNFPLESETTQVTVWDYQFAGNVLKPEICYYSVTSTCLNEKAGCDRLHARRHYHWQITDDLVNWANLPQLQVEALESAFCNPAEDAVSLPLFLQNNSSPVNQFQLVMGSNLWTADFEKMVLVSPGIFRFFHLRRLCTEKIPGHFVESSHFQWFFCDGNSNWVKYGRPPTGGKGDIVSNITSSKVEQHFLSMPHAPLTFKMAQITYAIDFRHMCQIDESTGAHSSIRRRPEYGSYIHIMRNNILSDTKKLFENHFYIAFANRRYLNEDKAIKTLQTKSLVDVTSQALSNHFSSSYRDLPFFWEPMQLTERLRRVTLSPLSIEYNIVVSYLKRYFSPKLKKVERIQHPFSWRALQNKIDDMRMTYKDESTVNIRWLFHGTVQEVVDDIIQENFDWRLHGTRVGQIHGQGAYFATDAALAYKYCRADDAGNKYLFIARVAVGTVTKGNDKIVRPPVNPETGRPCDSTGNNFIIVKYDKQEYYPEYLITFT